MPKNMVLYILKKNKNTSKKNSKLKHLNVFKANYLWQLQSTFIAGESDLMDLIFLVRRDKTTIVSVINKRG